MKIVMAEAAGYLSAVAALGGNIRRRHNFDRHLVAGPTAANEGAAEGAGEGRAASFVQAVHNEDASRLYLDALEHNTTELSKLVDIYSTLNRMRLVSSPKVVAAADSALRVIVGVYAKENANSLESGNRLATDSLIRCAPSARRAAKS